MFPWRNQTHSTVKRMWETPTWVSPIGKTILKVKKKSRRLEQLFLPAIKEQVFHFSLRRGPILSPTICASVLSKHQINSIKANDARHDKPRSESHWVAQRQKTSNSECCRCYQKYITLYAWSKVINTNIWSHCFLLYPVLQLCRYDRTQRTMVIAVGRPACWLYCWLYCRHSRCFSILRKFFTEISC